MNEHLMQNKSLFPFSKSKDSAMIKMLIKGYTTYRVLGSKSCNINHDKKYSNVYIEDGFHNEQGFYNGIIIVDNKDICEITTSPYKLRIDSVSYTKVKEKDATYGEIIFNTKKISIEDFKNKYVDEYFRYKLVTQEKLNDFKKCLEIDKYTPKGIVNAKNYYFSGKAIRMYEVIPINYSSIKNGVRGIPYLTKEKEIEFLDCINKLKILKVATPSNSL